MVYVLLILVAFVLFLWLFKIPKIGCTCMVTGAVKAGKSTFAVRACLKKHKRALFGYYIRLTLYYVKRGFFVVFGMMRKADKMLDAGAPEKPYLYSNIPLRYKYYRPLKRELLMRQERVPYKSVAYLGEFSLIADSMAYKDAILNEELLLWNKLWGHMSKGGTLVTDTQSVEDCHYSVKRCLAQYYYVHHMVKLPFPIPFVIMYLRECRYSADSTNVYAEDVEETLKRVLIPKRTWRVFDSYCYSVLTDQKPISAEGEEHVATDLKARNIVTFKDFLTM